MYRLLLLGALAAGAQNGPTIGEEMARRLGEVHGRHALSAPVKDCPDIGRSLRGNSGPVTCGCPAIARDMLGTSVWGNQVYTDDSNICLAAIHDGRVTTSGGRVTVWSVPGQAQYESATRNGITSWDYQDFDGSIQFSPPSTKRIKVRPAPADGPREVAPVGEDVPTRRRSGPAEAEPVDLDGDRRPDLLETPTAMGGPFSPIPSTGGAVAACPDTGQSLRGMTAPIQCFCPAIASDMLGTSVWGNAIYTDDSNICLAAIHDGRVTLSGGKVWVWADRGRKRYSSASRNGITSIAYLNFEGSIRFTPPPTRR
jgi:hypothetical protein